MKRTLKQMTAYITKQTDGYRKPKKKKGKSSKEKKVIDAFINNTFGCQRKEVGLLVNAIMGKKIITKDMMDNDMDDDEITLPNGVCIVPLIDNNEYEKGEPCVHVEEGCCICQLDGLNEEEIDLDDGAYRLATHTEIKKFIEQAGLAILNREL